MVGTGSDGIKVVNGSVFNKEFELLKQHNFIIEDNSKISLTKKGAFFADEVVTQFEDNKYIPFSRDAYSEGEFNPFIPNH